MKICHVITKPELGGAQLSTLNILLNLSKDKYSLSVITSPSGILAPEFKNHGVKTVFSPFLIRHINPIIDIFAFIHILLIYISNKYNVIHTHSSKAGIIGRWAAKFAGVKNIVHTVHGWPFNGYQPGFVRNLFVFVERVTAKFTTKIICVSLKDIETGLKQKIAPPEKFIFIKYGIDLSKFKNAKVNNLEKRKELGIKNKGPVVGMISCLKPQKSPLDFVRSAIKIHREAPDVNFLLVGDGVLRRQCEEILSRSSLNGNFIFAGWRMDIPELLDIMDVMVLTSKWEGMPISIIEAFSKSCPVVATDVGGVGELVRDGETGYLTAPGVYTQTAEKVLKILQDKRAFYEMKKRTFSYIDDSFDVHRMVNDIDRLYRGLK